MGMLRCVKIITVASFLFDASTSMDSNSLISPIPIVSNESLLDYGDTLAENEFLSADNVTSVKRKRSTSAKWPDGQWLTKVFTGRLTLEGSEHDFRVEVTKELYGMQVHVFLTRFGLTKNVLSITPLPYSTVFAENNGMVYDSRSEGFYRDVWNVPFDATTNSNGRYGGPSYWIIGAKLTAVGIINKDCNSPVLNAQSDTVAINVRLAVRVCTRQPFDWVTCTGIGENNMHDYENAVWVFTDTWPSCSAT